VKQNKALCVQGEINVIFEGKNEREAGRGGKFLDICHSTLLDPLLPNAQAIAAREMGRHCLFFNHLHIITQMFLLQGSCIVVAWDNRFRAAWTC
jgi:hypothetical protein